MLPVAERELGAKAVSADFLYNSDDNIQSEKSKGVVAPSMGAGKSKSVTPADFEFSDDGHVVSCPEGNKPVVSDVNDDRFIQ